LQATFLLGPAGNGKTYRCLAEIRAELSARPEGPPLLLLAPKPATFQLERQLLADPDLAGYTRLQHRRLRPLLRHPFVISLLNRNPKNSTSCSAALLINFKQGINA
jgi:ATP-dependent helicase/DNAse subunit B